MIPPRRAIVAGHICLDIIPDVTAIEPGVFNANFRPGHLLEAGAATLATGGPVSNTGLSLHKLGVLVRLSAKVGDDAFGHVIERIVNSIDPQLLAGMQFDPHGTTSYTIIISPPHIDRIFLHCPGANHEFGSADVNDDQLRQADLLHFGYPPVMRRIYSDHGRELADLLCRAKTIGLTTSLDLCYPDPHSEAGQLDWVALFRSVLPYVDVFAPSLEELLFMLRHSTFEELSARGSVVDQATPELLHDISEELIEMGVKIVLIKLGARGAYLRTASVTAIDRLGRATPTDRGAWADRELWAPCFKVEVIGTTGSGDATIAGFLSALLREASPADAMTMAVAVGACNVEAADALSGVRSWEDTRRRIADGWARLPLQIAASGWVWDSLYHLWKHEA
ncbi:MAG TPA: carbohydrate kinase family protein [Anaerolineae bacterium]|nr:carbohydrate kinase family protein [Anaerolineae bacterium]